MREACTHAFRNSLFTTSSHKFPPLSPPSQPLHNCHHSQQEESQVLRGEVYLQEQGYFSSQWCRYHFTLQSHSLTWFRAVHGNTGSLQSPRGRSTGFTKVGRVGLKDGLTRLSIPASITKQDPTGFPLVLSIMAPGGSKEVESHSFCFKTCAERLTLMRNVRARSTTSLRRKFAQYASTVPSSRADLGRHNPVLQLLPGPPRLSLPLRDFIRRQSLGSNHSPSSLERARSHSLPMSPSSSPREMHALASSRPSSPKFPQAFAADGNVSPRISELGLTPTR